MENVFRSERLVYRAIEDTPEDDDFMHLIQSDPVAYSNSDTGLLAPMTRKESGDWKKSVQSKKLIGVIICLAPPPSNPALPSDTKAPPPTPIGCIALTGLTPGHYQHRNSNISIDIIAPYQRKGYGGEAIKWIVDWGFRIAGLHSIGIECFSYNSGARELYEGKLGFVFEGRKRECIWYNGGWHDMLSFSMLESEWKKQPLDRNSRLWDALGKGDAVKIADYASKHFEKHKRPLRIAVDEAIWRFKYVVHDQEHVKQIREVSQRDSQPSEKNILYQVLKLLRLNIQLVFVTDDPLRPVDKLKDGKTIHGNSDRFTELLRETLGHLNIAWHKAPGEAEAECAKLQQLGIVDCVWTEDVDVFVFGAHTVLRFHYIDAPKSKNDKEGEKPRRIKDNTMFRVYRSEDNIEALPGFDREGAILFATLVGADYGKKNETKLPRVRIEHVRLALKNNFGRLLCNAFHDGTLGQWRERLERFLKISDSNVAVPIDFPKASIVKLFVKPMTSDKGTLMALKEDWFCMNKTFDEATLLPFLTRYNFWLKEYVEKFVPITLIQSLAQTIPGKEANNDRYKLRFVKAEKEESLCVVSFSLSSVTSIDVQQQMLRELNTRTKPAKNGPWKPPAVFQIGQMLDVILRYAVSAFMETVPPARVSKTKPRSTTEAPAKPRGRPRKDPLVTSFTTNAEKSMERLPAKKRERQEDSSASYNFPAAMAKKPKTIANSAEPAKQMAKPPSRSPGRSTSFRVPPPLSPGSSQLLPQDNDAPIATSMPVRAASKQQVVVIDLISDGEYD
ncbi:hypothetical protein VTL71DRAFT_3502, partial [Oculimacula yallundae]